MVVFISAPFMRDELCQHGSMYAGMQPDATNLCNDK